MQISSKKGYSKRERIILILIVIVLFLAFYFAVNKYYQEKETRDSSVSETRIEIQTTPISETTTEASSSEASV